MKATTNRLVRILMRRDGMERDDAEDLLQDARAAVEDGEDPEDVLADWFGLEPDYVFDLLG